MRVLDGVDPYHHGRSGVWWSATDYSRTNAYSRGMSYETADVYEYDSDKSDIFSVRCVKD